MRSVIVFAEGQTEEIFIKEVVAPYFWDFNLSLEPRRLRTSSTGSGGGLTIGRLRMNARNTLLQRPDAILTTFFDLYALDVNFPGVEKSKTLPDVYTRVDYLQQALHQTVLEEVQCRPERFIPHIQPYEFEALLFSDISVLCSVEENWAGSITELTRIRAGCVSPEHINDSYATAPSRRLQNLLKPKYQKTRHGPMIAERITLPVIERECLHFKSWMDKLRKLGQP